MKQHPASPRRLAALALLAPLTLLGCEDDAGIRSYEAPKDPGSELQLPATSIPGMPTPGSSTTAAGSTGATSGGAAWDLPTGWTTSPDARPMRLATFIAPTEDASDPLEVALSVFPSDVGGTLANVNRWRNQLGLDPITNDQLPDSTSPLVEGDDAAGILVEIEGQAEHQDLGNVPVAMIVAMVPDPVGDRTWFLKAVGLPDQVASQREPFIQFARTLPPPTAPTPSADAQPVASGQPSGMTGSSHADTPPGGVHWTAPAHWTDDPNPSSMLEAAYIAAAPQSGAETSGGGGEARITLMTLPGDGGGALPNINRWRGQVGLPALQTLADQPVQRLGVGGQPAVVLDLVGTPPGEDAPLRTVVALVARENDTWFIKMTGDKAAVQREAPHFQALLQSIHFH